jgi:IclR family transcriptional regulator, KDG regulon repressor
MFPSIRPPGAMLRRSHSLTTKPAPQAAHTPSAIPARYRVQVLDRSFRILEALAEVSAELSPVDLANRLRLHKSTIHRLLVVLEGQGFIRRTSEGKYGLGMKLIEMGSRAVEQLDLGLGARALSFLQQLVDETGETAHISVFSGNEMVSIANVQGRWTLRTPCTVGRRTQTYCTAIGKAFIAFLPEPELDALIAKLRFVQHTRHTIRTPSALKAELARVRRRGFAVDDEEVEEGLRCVGAPIRNYTGNVVASLSVAGPVFRIHKGDVAKVARAAIVAADGLSADLGHRAPKDRARRHVS